MLASHGLLILRVKFFLLPTYFNIKSRVKQITKLDHQVLTNISYMQLVLSSGYLRRMCGAGGACLAGTEP